MSKAHGGLGRGLSQLIQSPRKAEGTAPQTSSMVPLASPAVAQNDVHMVAISLITANQDQPRHRFAQEPLDELVSSIRVHGVLQPLVVRKTATGYQLIAGERRLRASMQAGLKEVPVRRLDCDDKTALEIALVENLQRENLNPMEEAEGYRVLQDKFGLTQEQVAEKVGKARASVANALRLMNLPDRVREMVEQGLLSAGHAKVVLGAPQAEQVALSQLCVRAQWSVRELEQRVARLTGAATVKRQKTKDIKDAISARHTLDLQEKLQQKLGTSVRVYSCTTHANGKKTKGRVEIDFFDADDLDRLMIILGLSDQF